MGNDEKIVNNEYPCDGMYGDIIDALDRSRDVVCTAAKITDESAKTALFAGVKIILANCISAIEDREKANNEPIITEEDD